MYHVRIVQIVWRKVKLIYKSKVKFNPLVPRYSYSCSEIEHSCLSTGAKGLFNSFCRHTHILAMFITFSFGHLLSPPITICVHVLTLFSVVQLFYLPCPLMVFKMSVSCFTDHGWQHISSSLCLM